MILSESDPQYREKATIWRVFSELPLYGALARGRVWRWFAVNIPMDLGTGGKFTSDVDIIARLHDFPQSDKWLYETREVKVSLLRKDGVARSLKTGKIGRTVTQLRAYRKFGSPSVSLLDIYLCEAGFMQNISFPPSAVVESTTAKLAELRREGFGYEILPFEYGRKESDDTALFTLVNEQNPINTTFNLLPILEEESRQPFSFLANRLHAFFERSSDRPHKSNHQIVFCRECRELQLIRMKDEHNCPSCHSDLVIQS